MTKYGWTALVALLIFVYLVLAHGDASVNVFNALASGGSKLVTSLQGR